MASATQHPHGPRPPTASSSHPPSTIAELAAKALDGLWDETKELKYYLKMAEKYRREAKEYLDAGDLENAFIFYAKAATLVLDKIPTHRDYDVKLRLQHKNNLGLNGQDILDQLAMIKEVLVERYQRWMAGEHPEQSQQPPPQQIYESSATTSYTPSPTPGRRSASAGRSSRARDRERSRDEREPQQPVSDDSSRRRVDRNKEREEKERERERERERRSRRNGAPSGGIGSGYTMVASGEDETRRLHEEMRRREEEHRMLQDARRRDEERERERERERRRKEEKARQKRAEEEEGILRRQREADDAARMARAAPGQPPPAPQPAPAPPQPSSSLSSIASSSMASISTIGSSPSSLFAPQHTPTSSLTTTPNGSMYGSFYTPTKASSSHPPAPASGAGSSYRPPSNQSSPYPPPPASAPISNGGPSNGFPPPPASAPMGSGYPPYSSSSAKSPVTPTPTSTANAYSYAPQSHTDNTTPTTTNTVHPLPPLPMPPPPQSAPVYGTQPQQQQQPYMYNFRPQPQPNPTPERPPTQSSIYAPPQPVSQPPQQQQQQAPRPEPQQQQPPAQQPQPQTRPMHAPQARSRPPSFLGTSDGISFLPLESPTKYEGDSTDSESLVDGVPGSRWQKKHHDHLKTPTRLASTSSGPPPVTTTSPPPADGRPIEYPRLMSPHQLSQGYTPSLNSMFSPLEAAMSKMNLGSETLLFDQRPGGSANTLYPREALPPQSAPAGYAMYGMQQQQPPHHQYQQQRPSPHRPPLPNPPTQQPQYHYQAPGRQVDTIPVLKTVSLPRDCLDKFLSIAKVNTSLNRETCGLLLGKDKGHKYVVTTLLVPKQHSTSDTCTMDEEELVMQFTEERNLITLGWIHTHPSQSCFMSSVDLHTHSGFQRMLPESFAVVCAPRFSPNFGIFRLTDPPGLKTVLDCKATEAFHPHPDLPIYTDAEKGHVQMRDLPLEIVDIR